MPLPDGFMKTSDSPRRRSSLSANCSNERAITNTKMIIPYQSVRAFIPSALPCGNLIRLFQRPKNGWSRNPQASLQISLLDEDRLLQLSQPGVSMHFGLPSPKVKKNKPQPQNMTTKSTAAVNISW